MFKVKHTRLNLIESMFQVEQIHLHYMSWLLYCYYVPILITTFPRTSAERNHGRGMGCRPHVLVSVM